MPEGYEMKESEKEETKYQADEITKGAENMSKASVDTSKADGDSSFGSNFDAGSSAFDNSIEGGSSSDNAEYKDNTAPIGNAEHTENAAIGNTAARSDSDDGEEYNSGKAFNKETTQKDNIQEDSGSYIEESEKNDIAALDNKTFSEDVTPKLTEEEIDKIADCSISTIQDFLSFFDIGEVSIDEYEGEEGELILDITGEDLSILIGRHGKNLDALQLLVSTTTYRKLGLHHPVIVDVEGYKTRQRQKLESMAFSAANKAITQDRKIRLRPMNSYERRIIHVALRNDKRVITFSEDEGDARHVVVMPQDA